MRLAVTVATVVWLTFIHLGCGSQRVAPGFAYIRAFSQASIETPQVVERVYSAHFDGDELVVRGVFDILGAGPYLRADFSYSHLLVFVTISTVGGPTLGIDDPRGYEVRITGLPPRSYYDVQLMHVDSSAGAERRTLMYRQEVVP